MPNFFEIPVTRNNKELSFKAYSVRFGYISHILVNINGQQVTIERDEEGHFTALGDDPARVDTELVKAVVQVLEAL